MTTGQHPESSAMVHDEAPVRSVAWEWCSGWTLGEAGFRREGGQAPVKPA